MTQPVELCHDSGVIPSEREWWNTILTGSLIHFHAFCIISLRISSGPGALLLASCRTALSNLLGVKSLRMSLVSPPMYSGCDAGWPSVGIRVSASTCSVSSGESVRSPVGF